MGDISKLVYNSDLLRSQARKIDKIQSDLKEDADILADQLTTLHEEWKSGASEKFFAAIDADWQFKIKSYCKMLEDMAHALNSAADSYDSIESSYNRLNLDV